MVAIHSLVGVVVKIADVETCQILINTNYTSSADLRLASFFDD